MRLIDGDALKEAFYQKMKELLKSTDTPQISNEALSLLCGASLITEAPTIKSDIERINNRMNEYINRKSVTVGLDYIINKLNKLITDDSPDDGYTDIKNQVEEIKRGVLNIPPADVQPVVQWIPCSERLPEKYGNYLVTTDDGEVDIGSCDPENKDRQDHFWSGCDADGFFWYGENIVIAWMPLPEGYRGEQDE